MSSLKLYRSMQCIACVCEFKVRNLIVRCDLKQNHFTMGSCSTPGSTTWWSRQFYWDKIQSNPRSPWYIWWFFRENLTFWGIFKVQFVLPSSIFVSFTSHRSRGVVVCWFVSSLIRAFSFVRSFGGDALLFLRSVVSALTCRFTFIYRFFGPLKGLPLNTLENYGMASWWPVKLR